MLTFATHTPSPDGFFAQVYKRLRLMYPKCYLVVNVKYMVCALKVRKIELAGNVCFEAFSTE